MDIDQHLLLCLTDRNFLNSLSVLAEYQYLEGEERIKYLMGQITDLRKVYMNLKSEVASIDRRRKRHRRKERETKAEGKINSIIFIISLSLKKLKVAKIWIYHQFPLL